MSKVFGILKDGTVANWSLDNVNNIELIGEKELMPAYDDDTKIWRYLDFTKFVSLLHSSSLFFTRLDNFFDKYEGEYLSGDWNKFLSGYDRNGVLSNDLRERIVRISRMGSFASCWHVNEKENYGMWKSYIRTEEGVAIQSTVKSLRQVLIKPENPYVLIDKVVYTDYAKADSALILQKEHAEKGVRLTPLPAFLKNHQYEFEQELRAVIWYELWLPSVATLTHESLSVLEAAADPYKIAQVDLNELIENVIIHPNAPHWFSGLVRDVMSKYGLVKPVYPSFLSKSS